jgi:hypothetical protein
MRRLMMLACAAGVLALSFGAVACGDDDDGDTSSTAADAASAENVTVTADEYSFDLSATPTADTTEFTFDNQGEDPHALVFARINEGFTLDEAYKLEGKKGSAELLVETDAGPGQTSTAKVKGEIEPGNYVLLCPLQTKGKPHYQLGQLSEFDIE